MNCSVEQIGQDRCAAATAAAKRFHATVVLKGHRTVIADENGRLYVNETGNPGMAVAGSGDVLAGMIAALLGQKQLVSEKHDPFRAEMTAWAVFYHGQAGARCAEELVEYGMTPGDMLNAIPGVLKSHASELSSPL